MPAPTVVGAAALMLAAGGAVTLGGGNASSEPINFSQASARTTSALSTALVNRQQAVSRDSRRQALADAADADLQDAADAQSVQRDAALQKLAQSAQSYANEIAANLWVSPLPVGSYRLTARFGQFGLWATTHTGLDMAAPLGTPVRAVTSGVVTSVGYDGSYGNKTVVTLADGTEIWYAHQNSYGVSVGQTVSPGQQIGEVGNTGNSTGSHLHIEVRPGAGDPVDPYAALIAHGVTP
ncbi:MAG: M23 family metallopeptidase [Nocardioides sp.]|nr:M23 family metallopeptidase [Nocardioides sp.]